MRIAGATLLAAAGASLWALGAGAMALGPPQHCDIAAIPFPAPPADRIGALAFRGGVELKARHRFLGGLSGLDRERGPGVGGGLVAVSDRGAIVAIAPRIEKDRLVGAECWALALSGADGKPLKGDDVDAEGVAVLGDGAAVISFERRHRLAVYVAPKGAPNPGPALGDIKALAGNRGLEALALTPDGGLLAGAESPTILGTPHAVWRFAPSSEPGRRFQDADGPAFAIASEPGFGLVGFAVTPLGHLITLERFWTAETGNRIKIGWSPGAEAFSASGKITVAELARLDRGSAVPVDNFEGVAAGPGPDGETRIWIVSDDNFSNGQKTLLYLFAFDEATFAQAVAAE